MIHLKVFLLTIWCSNRECAVGCPSRFRGFHEDGEVKNSNEVLVVAGLSSLLARTRSDVMED